MRHYSVYACARVCVRACVYVCVCAYVCLPVCVRPCVDLSMSVICQNTCTLAVCGIVLAQKSNNYDCTIAIIYQKSEPMIAIF